MKKYCLALPLVASVAQAQVVGWWTFEEGTPGMAPAPGASIRDISGLGNHGTPSGTGRYIAGFASDVAFDMPDDRSRILVADGPVFELQEGFTLETYVRLNSPGSLGDISPLLFRGDRRGDSDPWYVGINKDGGLTIQIWDGVTAFVLRSVEKLVVGEWVHVAGAHDPIAGRMRLYMNGRLVAESTGFVPPPMAELDPASGPTVAAYHCEIT